MSPGEGHSGYFVLKFDGNAVGTVLEDFRSRAVSIQPLPLVRHHNVLSTREMRGRPVRVTADLSSCLRDETRRR